MISVGLPAQIEYGWIRLPIQADYRYDTFAGRLRGIYLLIQHSFGSVSHNAFGIASFLAVDEDDAAQPAHKAHCARIDQLLLGDHGAAVGQHLHHACRGSQRVRSEKGRASIA